VSWASEGEVVLVELVMVQVVLVDVSLEVAVPVELDVVGDVVSVEYEVEIVDEVEVVGSEDVEVVGGTVDVLAEVVLERVAWLELVELGVTLDDELDVVLVPGTLLVDEPDFPGDTRRTYAPAAATTITMIMTATMAAPIPLRD